MKIYRCVLSAQEFTQALAEYAQKKVGLEGCPDANVETLLVFEPGPGGIDQVGQCRVEIQIPE